MKGVLVCFSEDNKVQEQNCFRGRMLPLRWDALPACADESLSQVTISSLNGTRSRRDAIKTQPIDLRGYRYQIFLLHSDAKGCVSWCRNLKQRDAKSTALLDYIENQVPDAPTFFLPHLHSFYLQKWFLSQFAFVVFPHNFCQLLSHTQKTRYWHGGFSKKQNPPHLPTAASFFFAIDMGFFRHEINVKLRYLLIVFVQHLIYFLILTRL